MATILEFRRTEDAAAGKPVEGTGEAVLNGERSQVKANSLVAVPSGTEHNFINTGSTPMKLFTVYSPPEEEPGTVHKTRAEAEEAEHH